MSVSAPNPQPVPVAPVYARANLPALAARVEAAFWARKKRRSTSSFP